MFTLILIILIIAALLIPLFWFRNNLIYKYRTKALNICYNKATEMIQEKYKDDDINHDINPFIYMDKYDNYPTYGVQLFQLTKWSFESLFPGLEDFCK